MNLVASIPNRKERRVKNDNNNGENNSTNKQLKLFVVIFKFVRCFYSFYVVVWIRSNTKSTNCHFVCWIIFTVWNRWDDKRNILQVACCGAFLSFYYLSCFGVTWLWEIHPLYHFRSMNESEKMKCKVRKKGSDEIAQYAFMMCRQNRVECFLFRSQISFNFDFETEKMFIRLACCHYWFNCSIFLLRRKMLYLFCFDVSSLRCFQLRLLFFTSEQIPCLARSAEFKSWWHACDIFQKWKMAQAIHTLNTTSVRCFRAWIRQNRNSTWNAFHFVSIFARFTCKTSLSFHFVFFRFPFVHQCLMSSQSIAMSRKPRLSHGAFSCCTGNRCWHIS